MLIAPNELSVVAVVLQSGWFCDTQLGKGMADDEKKARAIKSFCMWTKRNGVRTEKKEAQGQPSLFRPPEMMIVGN